MRVQKRKRASLFKVRLSADEARTNDRHKTLNRRQPGIKVLHGMARRTGCVIDWSRDVYRLGVEEMDTTHAEFAALVNCIAQTSAPEDLKLLLNRLLEHTREHFAHESALMRECGFAAMAEHEAEHARVLGDLGRFAKMASRGMPDMAKAFVSEFLPGWFEAHAQTMDAALAQCVKQHRRQH